MVAEFIDLSRLALSSARDFTPCLGPLLRASPSPLPLS